MTEPLACPRDKSTIYLTDEDCARLKLVACGREVVGQQARRAVTCRHSDAGGRYADQPRDLLDHFLSPVLALTAAGLGHYWFEEGVFISLGIA
ncbi:MAG: hypothetical protein ACSLEW_01295, partial [Nocardioides sp.]